jgi:CRP-like cAMP-binding protein
MTTINIFQRATDAVSFAAGQVIFNEGDPGDFAYGIQEGEVNVMRIMAERIRRYMNAG